MKLIIFYLLLVILNHLSFAQENEKVNQPLWNLGVSFQNGSAHYRSSQISGRYTYDEQSDISMAFHSTRNAGNVIARGVSVALSFPTFTDQQTTLFLDGERNDKSILNSQFIANQSLFFNPFSYFWGQSELSFSLGLLQFRNTQTKQVFRQDLISIAWRQEIRKKWDYSFTYTNYFFNRRNQAKIDDYFTNSIYSEKYQIINLNSLLDRSLDAGLGWQFLKTQKLNITHTVLSPYKTMNENQIAITPSTQNLTTFSLDSQLNSEWKSSLSYTYVSIQNQDSSDYWGLSLYYSF